MTDVRKCCSVGCADPAEKHRLFCGDHRAGLGLNGQQYKITVNDVLYFPCSRCGAASGDLCKTAAGREAQEHSVRWHAAVERLPRSQIEALFYASETCARCGFGKGDIQHETSPELGGHLFVSRLKELGKL